MRRLIAALPVLLLGLLPGAALAELNAAIAFSPSTGASGTAWNFEWSTDAENEAYANCGYDDCQTLVIFAQCGALAVGDGYGYGFGYDLSLDTATSIALQNCNAYTSNCQVQTAFCNDGY